MASKLADDIVKTVVFAWRMHGGKDWDKDRAAEQVDILLRQAQSYPDANTIQGIITSAYKVACEGVPIEALIRDLEYIKAKG